MIVRRNDFERVVGLLSAPGRYSLDSETTGLSAYHGHRLFSLILGAEAETFYFNFQAYPGLAPDWILPREWMPRLAPVLQNPESLFYLHNAKFDMHMLAAEGLEIRGAVHCTEAMARVLKNDHFSYKLAECAKRIGLEKSNAVDEHIKKHKLFTLQPVPGQERPAKIPHFDRVPFEIISKYGETDGRITRALGEHQCSELEREPTFAPVVENERRLTKTCFAMERAGIRVDREFTRRALAFEAANILRAKQTFEAMSGMPFLDSRLVLARAFDAAGEEYPRTEKGNPSFTDDVLEGFSTPLAQVVRDYRTAAKKANTYYRNFLKFADQDGAIHPNMRQAGTVTGRFSYSDPNLQNLNKPLEPGDPGYEEEQKAEFLVRRCFVPRPGHCFVMLDYDQMEYRMMLDYAGEDDLVALVKSGMDVHAATAQMMGVTRKIAKTINFMLLYGGGVAKLAASLGVGLEEATRLRALYFSRLPCVKYFISRVISKARTMGHIRNWAGRRYHFENPNFAYTAPNHLIQGGSAEVVKFAMNRIADYLAHERLSTRMLVQVHDEILFEVPGHELHIVPRLKEIMETTYPGKKLPLTCGVDHSWKSWADKEEGRPA